MHYKSHIFDQNIVQNYFLPTYLPYFISDRYRKQTIFFLGLSQTSEATDYTSSTFHLVVVLAIQ